MKQHNAICVELCLMGSMAVSLLHVCDRVCVCASCFHVHLWFGNYLCEYVPACMCVFLTRLRVCVGSLRSPGASLDVAPLLQSEDKASIANHHLSSVQTLKDPLWAGTDTQRHSHFLRSQTHNCPRTMWYGISQILEVCR